MAELNLSASCLRRTRCLLINQQRSAKYSIFKILSLCYFLLSIIHSFYFAINQKYNNSTQKYIKDNIQYSNYFIDKINPFAPEPPVTARTDPRPFYSL